MKDHELREFINELRDTSIKFKDAQQLRDRLLCVVMPFVKEHTDYVEDREKFKSNE